jgi:hypothetical protein
VPLPRDRGLISVVSGAITPPWRYQEDSLGLRCLWLSVARVPPVSAPRDFHPPSRSPGSDSGAPTIP